MNSLQIQFDPLRKFDVQHYKAIVNSYVPYSDHNFTSLYCWDTKDRCEIAKLPRSGILIRMDDYLEDQGSNSLLTIAGRTPAEELYGYITQLPHDSPLDLVPPYIINRLRRWGEKEMQVESDRDNYDYILSTNQYVNLSGKPFANKRKKINNLLRVYGNELTINQVEHAGLDRKALLNLYDSWKLHDTDGSTQAHNEYLAFKKYLDNSWLDGVFEFVNIEYRLNGELCGFSVSEITSQHYAIGHFMKANLDIRYLYDYIVYHTSKHLLEVCGVKFFNIEQDLGIDGLRTYKERHNPYKYLKKYSIDVH